MASLRRNGIQVRDATLDDVDALTRFNAFVRGLPGARRHARQTDSGDMRERYEALVLNPTRRVVLATDDADTALGMAVLTVDVAGELLDVPVVRMTHLVVDGAQRRRGAGRALVAAAVSYADDLGVEHVSVGAATTDREANRFLARLGFAPVVVRRIASLAVVRRHLVVSEAGEPPADVVRRHSNAVRRALSRPRTRRAEDRPDPRSVDRRPLQ